MSSFKIVLWVMIFMLSTSLFSQASKAASLWGVRVVAGSYTFHEDDKGFAAELRLSRDLDKYILLGFGINHGFGEDGYTSFELDLEFHLPVYKPIELYAGIGTGIMT